MKVIKPFGEVQVGDVLQGIRGPVTVTAAYEEHLPSTMYQVELENGQVLEASGNHLWYVETDLDIATHRQRLKDHRRIFSKLADDVLADLWWMIGLADNRPEIDAESLFELFEVATHAEYVTPICRILQSIGPVAEEQVTQEDVLTGERLQAPLKKLYDGKSFGKQVMALREKRYAKRWPVVRGRVVTTEEMLALGESFTVNLPEARPR